MKPDAEGWFKTAGQQISGQSLSYGIAKIKAGSEYIATYLQLRNSLFDLLDLHLAEAFDLEKRLACGSVDRLSSVSKLFRFE